MPMRLFFVVVGALALAGGVGRAAPREFKQTFAVRPGCTVRVDTYRGAISVVESDQMEVRVTLQMDVSTDKEEEADRLRDGLRVEATAADNVVTLRARNPAASGMQFVWNEPKAIDLTWEITVPRRCNVDLVTTEGRIMVGYLTGDVRARADKGAISLKRIDGSVDLAVEIGQVVVAHCSGTSRVRVLRGTIRVGTMGGFADLKNSTGDVEVLLARAGISASAEAGDVYVGFPKVIGGDAKIVTSGGSIFASIDPAASCTVSASSVWGRVETLVPMTVESGGNGKSRLTGRLGSGGPKLALAANGGHVKITPSEEPFE